MVDSLRTPENPSERLLESMSVRRADGREVPLAELSTTEVLTAGETIRAEEVVFHVPDGRSISALMNATPILSENEEVESVVVTLQDMTQLNEMERLRAEFLAMVSHELRTPLTSIRGSVTTLIDGAHSLRPTEISQFLQIILTQADAMRELISDLLDVARHRDGQPVGRPRAHVRSRAAGRGKDRLSERRRKTQPGHSRRAGRPLGSWPTGRA